MRDNQPGERQGRVAIVCLLAVQAVFMLAAGAAVILNLSGALVYPAAPVWAVVLVFMLDVAAAVLAVRFYRCYRSERTTVRGSVQLMETIMTTTREWFWAVDELGTFTFSSPLSSQVLGYSPEETARSTQQSGHGARWLSRGPPGHRSPYGPWTAPGFDTLSAPRRLHGLDGNSWPVSLWQ